MNAELRGEIADVFLARGVCLRTRVLAAAQAWMRSRLPDEGVGMLGVRLRPGQQSLLGPFTPMAARVSAPDRLLVSARADAAALAILHSHPGAPARPSPVDRDQIRPGDLHLILGYPDDPARSRLTAWTRQWRGPVLEVAVLERLEDGTHRPLRAGQLTR